MPKPTIDVEKLTQERADLIATVKEIEGWARYNDRRVRLIAIQALRDVGEWEHD